jgi:hypothetical protein
MAKTVRFDVLAVAKATGFDEADRKIQHLSGTAKKSMSGLATAALAITPALIPIAAAATGLGGIAVAGGAAVLAVKGIEKEMKAGTPIGQAYTANIAKLKGNLSELEHTAAAGVLTGFQKSVTAVQPLMPALNRDIAIYSHQLGDIAGNTGVGLVSLLRSFQPLFFQVNQDLVAGSQKFAAWAKSSDGVKTFVAYAQNQLPQVEAGLGSLAMTVGHLAQGFAPLGTVSLTTLGTLSRLINAIPIGTLQELAPAIAGVALAYKGLSSASKLPGLRGLNLGFSALGPAAGIAGVALGIFTGILGRSQARQAQVTAEVNSYTQALQASHGAITQAIRDQAAKNLQDSGALTAANKLGISLSLVTSAATGNKDALFAVTATTTAAIKAADDYASGLANVNYATRAQYDAAQSQKKALFEQAAAAIKVQEAVGGQTGELEKARAKYQQLADATQGTVSAQAQAAVTIDGVTTKLDKQTTASNLLKNALDRLNGTALSVEQTENAFLDTLGNLKTAHDAGTASIAQNNAKSRANREILVQSITAANDAAQATADQAKKTHTLAEALRIGAGALKNHEDAIRRAAAAAGLDKDEVNDLINKLGKIPKHITSNVELRTAAARKAAADLAAYVSRFRPVMEVVAHTSISGGHGKLAQHAAGGAVKDGWFTVGERGYELGYKQGSQVQFFSNQQSQLMTGMSRVPGYANGTAGLSGSVFARLRADIAGLARALGAVSLLGPAANKAVTAVGKILPGVGSVERGLNAENRALQADVARRGHLADQLKVANQRLADARKLLAEKAASVTQGLLGGFDLSQFVGAGGPAQFSVPGILDAAKTFADRMAQFRAQIKLLQKEGLNKTLLDQLIQQGPSAQADALAQATRQQIKALNLQYRRAGVTAAAIGGLDARSLYGAGVSAARGIVAGLRSQESALDKQMERLGRLLVRALNRALGIRSPARATMPAGKFAVLGLAKGIDDNLHHATAAAGRLGAAAIPGNGSYPSKMTGGSVTYNITINAGVGSDPAAIQRAFIQILADAANGGHTIPILKALR